MPAQERQVTTTKTNTEEQRETRKTSYDARQKNYNERADTTYAAASENSASLTYEPEKERKGEFTTPVFGRETDERNRDHTLDPGKKRADTYTPGIADDKKKKREMW